MFLPAVVLQYATQPCSLLKLSSGYKIILHSSYTQESCIGSVSSPTQASSQPRHLTRCPQQSSPSAQTTQGQCWRWNPVPPLHKAVSSPKPSALIMNMGPHTCLTVSLDRFSYCLNLGINSQAISFHHLKTLLGMLRSWDALPTLLLPLHTRIMDT